MITHQNTAAQKPRRVVLLGARGFIGAALQRRLKAGDLPCLGLTSAELDLAATDAAQRLQGLLQPHDAVVMLSALTPDKGRDIATLMKNLSMMQAVCAAIEKTGCAHFVYFSSDAVYNQTIARVTEETPPSPQDLYGAMHHTRELMARSLKAPVLVLRPTLVYGRDDSHNAYGPNRFRRSAEKEGKIALFGGGEETRDHIDVEDVAELTLQCLLRRSTGTLNVATGKSHSFHEVATRVARHFKNAVEIVPCPRANPITHRHYDITATIKAFPDFRFVALDDGLAKIHRQMTEKR
jgi:UDP-glucose 4-epimerase